MRNAHAPQHDMVAVAELMNIEPETCSNIAQGSQLESFCACEVIGAGELDVASFAFKRGDGHTGPLRKRGVVGEIAPACRLCAPMGVQQSCESEGLRSLCQPERCTVEGAGHLAPSVNILDGIGNRNYRDGGRACLCRRYCPADETGRDERAGRVVHENEFRSAGLQGLETGSDRPLPGFRAIDAREQGQALGCAIVEVVILRVDHRLDGGNLGVPGEGCERRPDHCLPEKLSILLGHRPAGAQSASGSDDYGSGFH